jgi:hypothetical protein
VRVNGRTQMLQAMGSRPEGATAPQPTEANRRAVPAAAAGCDELRERDAPPWKARARVVGRADDLGCKKNIKVNAMGGAWTRCNVAGSLGSSRVTSPGPTRRRLASERAAPTWIAYASSITARARRRAFPQATGGADGSGGPGRLQAAVPRRPLPRPARRHAPAYRRARSPPAIAPNASAAPARLE